MLKQYSRRWLFISVAMMMTFLSGWFWFISGRFVVLFWWWCLIPLWSVLALGNVRSRVVNGLPLFVLWLYLLLSLLTDDWLSMIWLFTATPYVSLFVKPKRNLLKYLTLILSTGLLLYGFFSGQNVSMVWRLTMVLTINVVFFPPLIMHKLKTFWQQKTRS